MPADPTDFQHEWTLYQRLRATPELLQQIADPRTPELRVQKQLREQFAPDLVRAALTLWELRKRAEGKFTRAAEMWFLRTSLEQSTPEAVARYKAERFAEANAGNGPVRDLCSGIGGDAVALAGLLPVIAVDRNPICSLFTLWNAEINEVAPNLQPICGPVEAVRIAGSLVHIDPDRRAGKGGRSLRIEDLVPDLAYLNDLIANAEGGAIKLSSASNFGGHFRDYSVELISLNGECKEATIWFGSLARTEQLSATVLPAGETLTGDPMQTWPRISNLDRWLYDPDPAVTRAGLIDVLADHLDLHRLDDQEEYLTSSEPVFSPFVQTFEVLEELPNNPKQIRDAFRKSDFGRVEIKCRHIPIEAEAIRKKLPLPGSEPGVLVFARIQGKSRAIVCRRRTEPAEDA